MFTTHRTHLVFATAVLISVVSIILALSAEATALVVVAFSASYNLWTLRRSEKEGFVQAKEMRRAYEPPRHFSGLQTLVLMILLMGQVGVGTWSLFNQYSPLS